MYRQDVGGLLWMRRHVSAFEPVTGPATHFHHLTFKKTAGSCFADYRFANVPPDAASRAFDPRLAAARAPFALETPRYHALGADGFLTLTTRHENGQDPAAS